MKRVREKRAWVKWALGGFLLFILLLTLFSNTLRNLSLPEIVTRQVTSGAIAPAVSGSGTVQTAGQTVVLSELSGRVVSLPVLAGEHVQTGQTVMIVEYLDDGTLAASKEQLSQMESSYEQSLLSVSVSGNSSSEMQLTQLKNQLSSALKDLERAKEYAAKRAQLDTQLSAAKAALSKAQQDYSKAVNPAQAAFDAAELALSDALMLQENAQQNESYRRAIYEANPTEEAERLWAEAKVTLTQADAAAIDAKNRHYEAQRTLSNLQRTWQPAVTACQSSVDDINAKIALLDSEYAGVTNVLVCENAVLSARSALQSFYDSQTAAAVQNEIQSLQLSEQSQAIEKLKQEIEAKELLLGEKPISALFDGTISEIPFSAGDTFQAEQKLFSVLDQESSYTLRFSVSAERAALLSLGENAQITNQSYGDVHAKLAQVVPDELDPGNSKCLIFDITGMGVAEGQHLSLRIPLERTSHDTVVVNQAVFQDAIGTFVYVAETSTSPLGTRTTVRRVDVVAVRSDDTYTAVEGDLNANSYVVVSSSAPLSDGQSVRFGS